MKFNIYNIKEELLLDDYTDDELKEIISEIDIELKQDHEWSRTELIEIIKKNIGKFFVDKKDDVVRTITKWDNNGRLSNFDIDDVLTQYTNVNNFFYLGCERMDFWYFKPKQWSKLKMTDLLKKGYTKFGLVLNLYGFKVKYKEHWVSIFIEIKSTAKQGQSVVIIDYFDSSDFKMPNQVTHLLYHFGLLMSVLTGYPTIFEYNEGQAQYYDGDCGIFAIDFIVKRLKGKTMTNYLNLKYTKEEMDNRRKKYFIDIGL